jgi:hypothetical protein
VDLGNGHRDGIFALVDCLFVLAITQLTRDVDMLALLQSLSKLRQVAPYDDAMPLGARVVLARIPVLPGRLRCEVEANEFFAVL